MKQLSSQVVGVTWKRLVITVVLATLPMSAMAQGGVVNSTKNPNQIALKHWYKANLTTSFPVGTSPGAVTFDGANIWVSNQFDNTVTKLRANDGANLGTFPVGLHPLGLAFDGASIWVSNGDDDTITKLRASDGSLLGTFPAGHGPVQLAFDGANLGVFPLGTFPAGVAVVEGVAFDGANIWVASGRFGSGTGPGRVSKL